MDGNINELDYIDETEEVLNNEHKSSEQEAEEQENIKEEKKELTEGETRLMAIIKKCLVRFYELMNDAGKQMNLKKSNFASAHGMYVENNYSSAFDMAKLCFNVMKDETF